MPKKKKSVVGWIFKINCPHCGKPILGTPQKKAPGYLTPMGRIDIKKELP